MHSASRNFLTVLLQVLTIHDRKIKEFSSVICHNKNYMENTSIAYLIEYLVVEYECSSPVIYRNV